MSSSMSSSFTMTGEDDVKNMEKLLDMLPPELRPAYEDALHPADPEVEELVKAEGLESHSDLPFKGNIDLKALEACILRETPENVPFVRLEAGTNLIGGQAISFGNMKAATDICRRHGVLTVLDASLLQDNLYFIKTREEGMKDLTVREITRKIADLFDIIYFSARKFGFARGGAILVRDEALFHSMEDLIPMFEGFLTYGGISVREIEDMAVGLYETTDLTVISQSPSFIEYFIGQMVDMGIPCVTPAGGLGAHIDAGRFLPHIPQEDYPAGALAAAFFIASGVRGMESGTLSSVRDENCKAILADAELLRLAFPRRVFTLSQVKYVADRMKWLYDNRDLIGGLEFVEEPPVLRFFMGKLRAKSDWPEKLAAKYRRDFGESM